MGRLRAAPSLSGSEDEPLSGRRGPKDRYLPRERGIGPQDDLAAEAQEFDVKELLHAGIAQEGPSHRPRDEANDGVPFLFLIIVGEP